MSKLTVVTGEAPKHFESPYKDRIREIAEECIAKNPVTAALIWEDSEGCMYMRWLPESPSFAKGIILRVSDYVLPELGIDDDEED